MLSSTRFFSVLLIVFYCLPVLSQNPVGIFDNHADIGHPKKAGSAQYDAATQTYTVEGGGYNIWFNRDEFQFLYKKIKGDFILTADFEFTGDTTNSAGHRKIGWMVRESTDEGAAGMNAVIHIDGHFALQWRTYRGMFMRDPEDEFYYTKKGGQTIQLERIGKTLSMYVAHWGEPLQFVGSHEMKEMKDDVLAGLFICSHDSNKVVSAKIWNVRIDKPVPGSYHPMPTVQRYLKPMEGVLGCRLETMNVFDGKRKVIHESTRKFEAPNWMPDGKKLLFNEGGFLYAIPVDGGTPEKFATGTLDKNNNDHGISLDGKMLAISSSGDGAGSKVYVLPLQGGTPKRVTEQAPSYFHGWAPGAKELLVVGQRNGSKIYNLYKVNVNTGVEVALTNNTKSHADGCEYSPDGKWIYYNANETGTMQIWRMKPDGSGKEQLTFDEYHSWFPHISPDGKWVVFISFPTDIEPSSHPSYKKVLLRLMPTAGGAPRVIANLYGGQGTLNVNSWSPDSKTIAFVSNSEKAE